MDFSWRSLFKVFAVVGVLVLLPFLSGSKLDDLPLPTQIASVAFLVMIAFGMALLLYGAFAPFVAVFVLTIREYRQTRSLRKAVKWPVEIVGGLLFAAAFMYGCWAVANWLRSFSAGQTIIDIFKVLFWIAIIGAAYDRYTNRGKKLKSYTPSDRTDIAKK